MMQESPVHKGKESRFSDEQRLEIKQMIKEALKTNSKFEPLTSYL